MRLIDADALSKKIMDELHNRSMQGFGKGLIIANSCVINAPTIEPDTDTISRRDAMDALWKALYEYEDKTEKQFQESEDLDVGDWILHRIFVQNMSDIDRQTILNLPSTQPERQKGEWIDYTEDGYVECPFCHSATNCDGNKDELHFCFSCGAKLYKAKDVYTVLNTMPSAQPVVKDISKAKFSCPICAVQKWKSLLMNGMKGVRYDK